MTDKDHDLNIRLAENEEGGRFIARDQEGQEGYLAFTKKGATLVATTTQVPEEMGGKGVGSALMRELIAYADKHRQVIYPQCSFVEHQFNKHPEWTALRAP